MPAGNVNTIDEVPDSNWFTNRIGTREISLEEGRRGPNTMAGPAPGRWTVVSAKAAGFAPGFTVRDEQGELWFVSFDGKGQPEAATGAIAVASKLFWALGYYQVESYLTRMKPDQLVIGDTATVKPPSGRRRPMRMSDVEEVLARAHRSPDGTYRALAGRGVSGKPIGGFRSYGTRSDDPNDVVPHEHRRELRALKVFGAWTNLVDMKAGNTLDVVVKQGDRSVIRHYLQDVGSTFGTGAVAPREWDEGYEYLYEGDTLLKRLVTLGFYIRPWQTIPYERHEAIGRFEGDRFDPEAWRSRAPAAAVVRARADDTFWAVAPGHGLLGRPDPGHRQDRGILRSGRREASGRRAHQAARPDWTRLPGEGQPAGRVRARRERDADLRECRRPGRSSSGPGTGLSRRVVDLRPRRRAPALARRRHDLDDGTDVAASRVGVWRRRVRGARPEPGPGRARPRFAAD